MVIERLWAGQRGRFSSTKAETPPVQWLPESFGHDEIITQRKLNCAHQTIFVHFYPACESLEDVFLHPFLCR